MVDKPRPDNILTAECLENSWGKVLDPQLCEFQIAVGSERPGQFEKMFQKCSVSEKRVLFTYDGFRIKAFPVTSAEPILVIAGRSVQECTL